MSEETVIAKGSFWSLSSALLSKFIAFLYTIIIARLVVTEEVGIFYLVLSVLGIFYIFTDLGLIYSLRRYVPFLYGKKQFAKLRDLIKISYFCGGLLTIFFSIGFFFLSDSIAGFLHQPTIAPILKIMSIYLFIKEIDDVNRGILVGRKKMKESQGLMVLQNLVKLLVTLIAFYVIGFNASALGVGFLLSFLLILPLGLYYVMADIKMWKQEKQKRNFKEHFSLGKEVLTFGIIITLITTLWMVIQYTDRIMLGFLTSDALSKVAIYSIALGLANLILLFPTAITMIFFPVVSELFGKKDLEGMARILKTTIKWLIFILFPFTIIMVVFGDLLLILFYGADYGSGATVLMFFVFGLFLKSLVMLPINVLSAMRRLDAELKAAAAAAIANVLLNLLFIPIFGINGAALASLFSFVILSLVIYYYSKRIFNFTLPTEAHRPLLAGIMVLIILFVFRTYLIAATDNFLLLIQENIIYEGIIGELVQKIVKFVVFGSLFLISVFVYFVALIFLRAFGKEDLDILEKGLIRIKAPRTSVLYLRKFLENPFDKIKI